MSEEKPSSAPPAGSGPPVGIPSPPRWTARRLAAVLSALAALLLLPLGIGAWVLTPFRIQSPSMEPTLLGERPARPAEPARPGAPGRPGEPGRPGQPARPGDTVLVNRLAYLSGGPARWEVVVFRPVEKEPPGNEGSASSIVKRVVGLPGETVEIEGGEVTIDGRVAPKPEALRSLRYLRGGSFGSQAVRLGPEEYFVLGDNSYPSLDSRRFGPLPRRNLLGRAVWIVLPLDRAGPIP